MRKSRGLYTGLVWVWGSGAVTGSIGVALHAGLSSIWGSVCGYIYPHAPDTRAIIHQYKIDEILLDWVLEKLHFYSHIEALLTHYD